jgi:hypothetical protein
MKSVNQRIVDLQSRFAPRQHNVTVATVLRPERQNLMRQQVSIGVSATESAIHPNKIGIAKSADRCISVRFTARPQIAT